MGEFPGLITINQQQTIFCYKHGIFRWSGKKLLRMKVVIQRVSSAEVRIEDQVEGSIDKGLLILLGIENTDEKADVEWLVRKIMALRIFNDPDGTMNLSILDIAGELLVVSQFTLHASTKKGNRPSYIKAAKPETAIPLYQYFLKTSEHALGGKVAHGQVWCGYESLINQ